jgi:MarR family transcriptional regulator for hemolysin
LKGPSPSGYPLISVRETRLYVNRLEQRVGALGLTLPECKVLLYPANHEGISQVRLAELTKLEQMTLARCLDGLESFGCLERRLFLSSTS